MADQPRTPVACFALDATPRLVRVVDVECPMSLCQLCGHIDWATARQFRPLKGSALGAPARTGDAGGVPASTEHPFEPESLAPVPIPKPGCCKAPDPPARTPTLPTGSPLRSQQSAGLRCVVSPCPRLRPRGARSRGRWDTPLGGGCVYETATSVGLVIFVY